MIHNAIAQLEDYMFLNDKDSILYLVLFHSMLFMPFQMGRG